jgi:hypothetical protein
MLFPLSGRIVNHFTCDCRALAGSSASWPKTFSLPRGKLASKPIPLADRAPETKSLPLWNGRLHPTIH